MATEARWLVSMAESDQRRVREFLDRCKGLGRADSVAGALRLAVELADSLTDEDIQRGFA